MDSEFDSLDDFLAAPGYDDGAAKKFKPKVRGRPRPRPSAVSSARPAVGQVNSNPPVVEAALEKFIEVIDLTPPNGANPIGDGDSSRYNNVDGLDFRVSADQLGLVSTEPLAVSQETVTYGDGSAKDDFLEDLAVNGGDGCPNNTVEQKSDTTEPASLQWNPFDDIDLEQHTSTAKASKFRPKLKYCQLKETFTSAESGCLDEAVPLEDMSRVEIQNSSVDIDMDNAQYNDENNEEVHLQSRSFSEKSHNDNEKQNSGRTEAESCGLFDSDLLGAPSVFPPANDYFSMNEHTTYSSAVGGPSATLPDDVMHMETAQEIPSERVDDRVPAEGNGTRKPARAPRKRKARSTQPSDAVDGEINALQGEICSDSAVGSDVSNNNIEGDTNFKKKGVKRSRKSAADGVKQTRSRKKANETSGLQSEKPKKKFSHSTRGRRKLVDPELLETPDDLIDPTRYPLKDLIHRADILERNSKKIPTPPSTPAVVQRIESPPHVEETFYAWNNFESNQPEDEYQYDMEVQEASSYFNYHSYMKRTPRMKWTKLDTELFYQGIREYGTDFTLIQKRHFPDRTRDQIKSKYKKEEREQPMRITEAIVNRATGVLHLQKVIEQLKAAEVQENQDFGDDLDGPEANEDNIQEASLELNEEDVFAKDDAEASDVIEMQEPEKMNDDYDELNRGGY